MKNKSKEFFLAAGAATFFCAFLYWGKATQQKCFFYNKSYCLGYHISAYNFYKYDSLFNWYEADLVWKDGVIVSRQPYDGSIQGHHPVIETIGFSFLVGLMWKVTNSPSTLSIEILYLFLFIASLILLYYTSLLLINSSYFALCVYIATLFFFPLVYTAVQPRNDIWTYFGIIALLYTVLSYKKTQSTITFLGAILVGLLQWIRSALFGPFIFVLFVLIMSDSVTGKRLYRSFVLYVLAINVVVFWVPFMIVNVVHYGRSLVGPFGLLGLVGLGEFPNKWGIECNDSWCAARIKYPLGTLAFDDEAKQMFLGFVQEDPWYYISCLVRRVKSLFFWNFTWFYYDFDFYHGRVGFFEKISFALSNPILFVHFFFQSIYIRLFFLLGYFGIILASIKRHYFFLSLIGFGVIGAIPLAVLSHIEDRYIVVHFWAFSFFVAYFFYEIPHFFRSYNFKIWLKRLVRQHGNISF